MDIHSYIEKLRTLPDKQKKIILWVIIVFLVSIMGYFWIRNTINNFQKLDVNINQIKLPEIQIPKDEISDWKTYKNDEYGYEIKYPNDWYVKEIEQGIVEGGVYFSPHRPDEIETGGIAFTNEALSVSIDSIIQESSLLKFAGNYLNLSVATKFEIENIKISEIDGIKVKIVCEGVGCDNPHWFVVNNNNIYIFNSNLSSKDKIDSFEKILSTFKFIE